MERHVKREGCAEMNHASALIVEAVRQGRGAFSFGGEKSRDFLERVMLAVDGGLEERQRREWRSITGGLELEEYVPREDFAMETLRRAKSSSRRSLRPHFWRIAAAVAAAFLSAACLLPKGGKAAIAAEAGAERFEPALCSIALLAAQSHPHGGCAGDVPRLRRLLEGMQREDGSFGGGAYDHAFASYALAENDVSRGGELSPNLARAIACIERTQECDGGWDGGNHLVSLWHMGVLSCAMKLGWEDGNGTLRRAMRWLGREAEGGLLDLRRIEDPKSAPSYASIYLAAKAANSVSAAAKSYRGTENLVSLLGASCSVALARYETASPEETPNFVRSVLQRGQNGASRQMLLARLFPGK